MKIELYVVSHNKFNHSFDNTFIPIQVGNNKNFFKIRDNIGNNISYKNDSFCELTALYWIWKNTSNQDYVGLLHYRRHLNFSFNQKIENIFGVVDYNIIDNNYINENNLNYNGVCSFISDNDLILPKKWDVRSVGSKNMIDHYAKGAHQNIEDYNETIEIIKKKHPEYYPFVSKVNNSYTGYFTNIFISRREFFDSYCEWLFDILFELEKKIDITNYSIQEKRVFGYISEWLFNVFLEKKISDKKEIKIIEAQRTFIHKPDGQKKLKPSFSKNNTPILLTTNDKYSQYAGVLLSSIIKNSNRNNNYDIYIFDGGISTKNKENIKSLFLNLDNFNLSFLDPEPLFQHYNLFTYSHFSRDIYYRILSPEIFSEFERIIYIDCDTLVKKDIAFLMEIDIEEKSIGAVKDVVMDGFIKYKTVSNKETGNLHTDEYLKKYLGITKKGQYFQSGVLIFNINRAIKKINLIKEELNSGKKYWFPDQDILNKVYINDVFYIDNRWNVMHGNGDLNTFFMHLPANTTLNYLKSRKDPYIIHYAGPNKPWLNRDIDFANEFWSEARHTPWYENLLIELINSKTNKTNKTNNLLKKFFSIQNEINQKYKRKFIYILGIKLRIKKTKLDKT